MSNQLRRLQRASTSATQHVQRSRAAGVNGRLQLFGSVVPWPRVAAHDQAQCFDCHRTLTDVPRDDGFADGHGRYSALCTCGWRTWYDLAVDPE
jgi:hypothetical protein